MTHFGSEILRSEFPHDDGTADASVLSALISHATSASEQSLSAVMAALKTIRVLVPVVAAADEVDEKGADKSSHMSSVIFKSADGRTGLPVFTGTAAMLEWDPQARPVPRLLRDVAQSAIDEKFDAVLIDMASAHRFALQGIALAEIAGVAVITIEV